MTYQFSPFARRARRDMIAVRTGCVLGYQATRPAPIMLLCTPQPDKRRRTISEAFTASQRTTITRSPDAHGNFILRTMLQPGYNEFRHEGIYLVPENPDHAPLQGSEGRATPLDRLPVDVLRYTLPSRYCESDKLVEFAARHFGGHPAGLRRVLAICDWVRRHIEYRYGSGSPLISAWEILQRGYGVCRDFAHVAIALCRALDLPARYVAGHIPRRLDVRYDSQSDIGIDFHAYIEVYLDDGWHTFDARHGQAQPGTIKLAHGLDAVDAAFATFYGEVEVVKFDVWANEIRLTPGKSPRLDGLRVTRAMPQTA